MKLTQEECKCYRELADRFTEVPPVLVPRLEQYAVARHQWELLIRKIRQCKDDGKRYKFAMEMSMFAKQMESAQLIIERHIEKANAPQTKKEHEAKAEFDTYWGKAG